MPRKQFGAPDCGFSVEVDQVELVSQAQKAPELVFRNDLAERTVPRSFRRPPRPPRPLQVEQRLGPQIADERLIRGVAQRVLVGAQVVAYRRQQARVGDQLPRRLRAVRHQAGHMNQHTGDPTDDDAHAFTANTVGSVTGVWSARSATRTRLRRKARSASGGRVGSLAGCGMRPPLTMRLAPTRCATGVMAVSRATGIPVRSISFASVAPQRVPVAQVAGRTTPPTPACLSSAAMAEPNAAHVSTGVPLPTVTKYLSSRPPISPAAARSRSASIGNTRYGSALAKLAS